MSLSFQRESFAAAFAEAEELIQAHWREVDHFGLSVAAVDESVYAPAESAGMLRVYTARAAGQLAGYATYFVRPSPHARQQLHALHDTTYLAQQQRRGAAGIRFLRYCADMLRAEGVQIVYQHSTLRRDHGRLLERLGYEPVETVYARRLD